MPHPAPTVLLIDTDLDTDCDDAGALAIVHALERRRECRLAGIVCSAPVAACAPAARAINLAYGRPDVPVGRFVVAGYDEGRAMPEYRRHRERFAERGRPEGLYAEALAATLPPDDPWRAREAVGLYRERLAAAPPQAAVICAVGTLSALAALLASGPDEHSPLPGPELVRRSVRELVTMARGVYPEGVDSFNWRMDLAAAAGVLARWPTPVTVSPVGDGVQTGARFVAAAPPGHPVRHAYIAFLGGEGKNRASWDQTAALYAVRGAAGGFDLGTEGGIVLDPATGRHRWADTAAGGGFARRLVTPRGDEAEFAAGIEDLMIESLGF